MTEYQAIYKCRLCGEEFKTTIFTSVDIAIKRMINITTGCTNNHNIINPVTETYKHSCMDGSMGIADFLGFRKVEVED